MGPTPKTQDHRPLNSGTKKGRRRKRTTPRAPCRVDRRLGPHPAPGMEASRQSQPLILSLIHISEPTRR
eukprot:10644308-Heterocapsa_arctica.AAC.1